MSAPVVIPQSELASVRLNPAFRLKRRPPRPPELRQPGYEDTFDFHTLFFDCYRLKDGTIRFQGPPPMNLRRNLLLGELSLGKHAARVDNFPNAELQRMRRTFKMDIPDCHEDRFDLLLAGGQSFTGPVNENHCDWFASRRVLMTMIKYDPLEWVSQWVEFFVKAHGIDAVLIFNNQAPDYSSEDIAAALNGISGLEKTVIIDWFFPYGPGAGETGRWDSAFTQVGAMEYARYRFLADAKCVVNADVDELVFSHNAHAGLCQITEESETGYSLYRALWAGGPKGPDFSVPPTSRQYRNSHFVNAEINEHGSKWSVVPEKCTEKVEWGVHKIPRIASDDAANAQLCYRNFQEFNTGWKAHRDFGNCNFKFDDTMYRTFKDIGWLA